MTKKQFASIARELTLGMAIVVAFVSFGPDLPDELSTGEAWRYVAKHPTLLLHVLVASALVIRALMLTVMSIRSANKKWITYSTLGMAGVLIAYGAGEMFVAKQDEDFLAYMSFGWALAAVVYAVAWLRERK